MPTKLRVSTLFKGIRDTYIRVPSSTTRDSIRHKMVKSGNFLPRERERERERRYCESPTSLPSFFFSFFFFFPFLTFSLSLPLLLHYFLLPFHSPSFNPPLFLPFFFLLFSIRPRENCAETCPRPVRAHTGKFRVYPTNFLLIFHPVRGRTCRSGGKEEVRSRSWPKLSGIQPSKKLLDLAR